LRNWKAKPKAKTAAAATAIAIQTARFGKMACRSGIGFGGNETGKGAEAFGVLLPDLLRLRAKRLPFSPVA
jgi:hypothetical protein